MVDEYLKAGRAMAVEMLWRLARRRDYICNILVVVRLLLLFELSDVFGALLSRCCITVPRWENGPANSPTL